MLAGLLSARDNRPLTPFTHPKGAQEPSSDVIVYTGFVVKPSYPVPMFSMTHRKGSTPLKGSRCTWLSTPRAAPLRW
jgi:hypothetical protein